MKIPLHSLIFVIGPDENSVTKNNPDYVTDILVSYGFEEHEIKSVNKKLYEMSGSTKRFDLLPFVSREIEKDVDSLLSIGERIILIGNYSLKHKRDPFINIAKKYRIPIYYIIMDIEAFDSSSGSKQKEIFENNYNLFSKGDGGTATVLHYNDNIVAVKKFPGINCISELIKRNFCGITQVGDVHGSYSSFIEIADWATSRGHLLLSTGDLFDYGAENIRCIDLAYDKIVRGSMILCIGNHERKIERWIDKNRLAKIGINSNEIILSRGNLSTTNEIDDLSDKERIVIETKIKTIINLSRHHYNFGNTIFVHAACDKKMFQNYSPRLSGKLEMLALYGESDGTKTAEGYPTRLYNWIDEIPEDKQVIVGHDILSYSLIQKRVGKLGGIVYFTDTGSGKGGKLSSIDLKISNDLKELKVNSFSMR